MNTWILRYLQARKFPYLNHYVIEVNNLNELMKVFGWKLRPTLRNRTVYEFEHSEDLNERRIRDAEVLGVAACNTKPSICLDIGTGFGHSAALMALNAPQSQVHTVNILPEDMHKGGKLTTGTLKKEEIGAYYKEQGLINITQHFANTARWTPNIGNIDVAFIDGCHDTKFVYNDTKIVLKHMRQGSFVLWHDFNLDLVDKYPWIRSVCAGVEKLFAHGLLNGQIFHVRDSWIRVYRV